MILNIVKSIIKNRFGVKQYPSFVTFFITWRCNSKCVMCDVWKKRQEKNELTLAEIEKIFKELGPLDAMRISGGEPFLKEDISDIINAIYDKSKVKVFHITTNGFLTDKIVSDIKKIKPIRNVHIKISIDSVGDYHDEIRGVRGAYKYAIKTAEELSKLRKEKKFYLGVNQTIIDRKSMNSYYDLQNELKKFGIAAHPVFAYTNSTALYSGDNIKTNPRFTAFGDFEKEELAAFIRKLIKDASLFSDIKETLVKRYYLKGVLNRVIKGKEFPKPLCLALKNHLRILPNGDIPVCLYNSNIVGNLKKEKFEDIWFGDKIEKCRDWVDKCPGCWAGCESIVSAVYSGDIVKGFY